MDAPSDERTTPERPGSRAAENGFGAVALVALILALLGWLGVGPLEPWWPVAVLVMLGAGLLALMAEGHRTGKLSMRGGRITREELPKVFWGFTIFYTLLGVAFLVGAVALAWLQP